MVPSQFATAFPQKAVGARSPNNRHRNSLLVGLTRSPLAGPSSFLGLFITSPAYYSARYSARLQTICIARQLRICLTSLLRPAYFLRGLPRCRDQPVVTEQPIAVDPLVAKTKNSPPLQLFFDWGLSSIAAKRNRAAEQQIICAFAPQSAIEAACNNP